MTEQTWQEIDLSGKPRMLVGRRKGSKRFDANQVELHADLFDEVRSICGAALAELDRREAKPYFPFAAASTDDYLVVDVTDLPGRVDRRKKADAAAEPAAALSLISETDSHKSLTATELRNNTLTMYAFSFKVDDGYVGFIRNTNPRRRVTPGLRFLRFENVLRRVEQPDLAIDDEIDVVVTPRRIAILSLSTFNTLFGDVGVAFRQVPGNVRVVADALANTLPLTDASLRALLERCGRRVIDAKRLNHIASERAEALAGLDKKRVTDILRQRGLTALVKKGKLEVDEDSASEFLDAVEGRLFSDDVTGEERRADAYSPRRHR